MFELNDFFQDLLSNIDDESTGEYKDVVSKIINDNGNGSIAEIIVNAFENNKMVLTYIFILGLLSMVITALEKKTMKAANIVISLIAVSMLVAVFISSCNCFTGSINDIISFYKILCPIFFPAVSMSCGVSSSVAFYELAIFLIYIINLFIKNVLLKVNICENLLGILDSLTDNKRYSKVTSLLDKLIKLSGKVLLGFIFGLNGIKSLIYPVKDSLQVNAFVKTVSLIPGVGNGASSVTKQVMGSAVLIKNSIGVLSIIAILLLVLGPLLQIVISALLLELLAAVLEPVSSKEITAVISNSARGLENLIYLMFVSTSLLCITIAMICYSTNLAV